MRVFLATHGKLVNCMSTSALHFTRLQQYTSSSVRCHPPISCYPSTPLRLPICLLHHHLKSYTPTLINPLFLASSSLYSVTHKFHPALLLHLPHTNTQPIHPQLEHHDCTSAILKDFFDEFDSIQTTYHDENCKERIRTNSH